MIVRAIHQDGMEGVRSIVMITKPKHAYAP